MGAVSAKQHTFGAQKTKERAPCSLLTALDCSVSRPLHGISFSFSSQVGYSTVFFWEYFGPLVVYPLFYLLPHVFYPGQP